MFTRCCNRYINCIYLADSHNWGLYLGRTYTANILKIMLGFIFWLGLILGKIQYDFLNIYIAETACIGRHWIKIQSFFIAWHLG